MKNLFMAGATGLVTLLAAFPAVSNAVENSVTIVITASRGAETVDETMAPVTVIDQKQIERSGKQSVGDILVTVPGLVVTNNGGPGKSTSVFLRGTNSDHVLVLIDGVKVGSATLGTVKFEDIPLSMVEKIEVVRGPRSSLYGSEALGGVIQIFTRKGRGEGFVPSFSVSAGSRSTRESHFGLSYSTHTGWFSADFGSIETEGFNALRGDGEPDKEPDDDGYSNSSLNFRGGGHLSKRLELEAGLYRSESENEYDGSFQNNGQSQTGVTHVETRYTAGRWQSRFHVSESSDQNWNFLDDAFRSRFETERQQVSWINDYAFTKGRVIAGMDYIEDEVDSTTNYDVSTRDNTGYFASVQTEFAGSDVEVSLRNDDNEQFGTATTGGFALGRMLGRSHRATVSYGTAFKAPTFNQLYWPSDPVYGGGGNPDLKEETSRSANIGFSGRGRDVRWSVDIFRTIVSDLIGYDATFMPVNLNKAKITGAELTVSTVFSGWEVSGNWTIQNPRDEDSGKMLRRRAKNLANLNLDRRFGSWGFGASLQFRGHSYDDAANQTKVDGFALLDVRAERHLAPGWSLGIKINNLFSREYETVRLYNQDGVNGAVTLRYSGR